MIRQTIREHIVTLVAKEYGDIPVFLVRASENPEHGDYASNIAMALAKKIGAPPMEIAEKISARLKEEMGEIMQQVNIAPPGFVNMFIGYTALRKELALIAEQGEGYGSSVLGKGKKARVEYVSANPTGPLHIGNARGGPIGEVIAKVLERSGYSVLREYLHNDAGTQVEKMGATLMFWYQKESGIETEFPEGGYRGEYLKDLAHRVREVLGSELTERDLAALTRFALDAIFKENMETLERMQIRFGHIEKESELLSSGKTKAVVEEFKERGAAREQDGALWFAPAGDEFLKDREAVLVRSTGQPTYFASDAAYHKEKFTSGYDLVVNVLGSNHHGHVPKLMAIAKIFGFPPANFRVPLYQYVRVKRGSEVVKMSKRAGTYVTAREVLDETGADAMIFFLLMNAASSHMDFDLELATRQSRENPVYYVQYAHARIASILKKAVHEARHPARFELLKEKEELELIKKMIRFPEIVEDTVEDYQIQRLPHFAIDLARSFHNFYEHCRVLDDDANIAAARLALVTAAQIVLKNTLFLIGVSAPDEM